MKKRGKNMKQWNDLFEKEKTLEEKITKLINLVLEDLKREYQLDIQIHLCNKKDYLFEDMKQGRIYQKLNTTLVEQMKQNIFLCLELLLKSITFELTNAIYVEQTKEYKHYINIFYKSNSNPKKQWKEMDYYQIIHSAYHEFYHHLTFSKELGTPDIRLLYELENIILNQSNLLTSSKITKDNQLSELAAESYASIKSYEFLLENKIDFNYRYARNQIEKHNLQLMGFDNSYLMEFLTPQTIQKYFQTHGERTKWSIFFQPDGSFQDLFSILQNANKERVTLDFVYSLLATKTYINSALCSSAPIDPTKIQILNRAIQYKMEDYQEKLNYIYHHSQDKIPNEKEQALIIYNVEKQKQLKQLQTKLNQKYNPKRKIRKKDHQ